MATANAIKEVNIKDNTFTVPFSEGVNRIAIEYIYFLPNDSKSYTFTNIIEVN